MNSLSSHTSWPNTYALIMRSCRNVRLAIMIRAYICIITLL